MNKVTQSIYKQKVDNLENDVKELQNMPVSHHYIVTFGDTEYTSVNVYIFTTENILLTASDMFDYMLEATRYHGNSKYKLLANGWDKRSSTWKPITGVAASQAYPAQEPTSLAFYTVEMSNGVQNSFYLNKEAFVALRPNIIKVY